MLVVKISAADSIAHSGLNMYTLEFEAHPFSRLQDSDCPIPAAFYLGNELEKNKPTTTPKQTNFEQTAFIKSVRLELGFSTRQQ